MKSPFEELSSVLDADKLRLWTKDAEKADNERGEALDVYNLQMDKGWSTLFLKMLRLIILFPFYSSNTSRDETQSFRCQDIKLRNTKLCNMANRRF